MVNNITQIYIELRTQNFIQYNYEDLYTNIKNISYKWCVKINQNIYLYGLCLGD